MTWNGSIRAAILECIYLTAFILVLYSFVCVATISNGMLWFVVSCSKLRCFMIFFFLVNCAKTCPTVLAGSGGGNMRHVEEVISM